MSDSEVPAPRRLWEALVGHRRDDGGVAVVFRADAPERVAWTAQQLAGFTEGFGGDLAAAGIGPGDLVGVLSHSQEVQAVHLLAILAAGACPAILTPPTARQEPEHARRTLTGVLDTVRPRAVISDLPAEVLPVVEDVALLHAWSLEPDGTPTGTSSVRVPPDVAFVQFSSGTTGLKKGVAVGIDAVLTQIRTYADVLDLRAPARWDGGRIDDGDAVVSWLPLYHDMGFLTALLLPLATGTPVAMIDPMAWTSRPVSYLEVTTSVGATLGWHPNFALNLMATRIRDEDLEGVDLSRLRMLANCSEPVTWPAQRRFVDRYAPFGLDANALTGCYAMAETTFAVTYGARSLDEGIDPNPPAGSGHDRRPMVSVGRALPGVEMVVRDPDGVELAERTVGEIWIRAPFLAEGYLGQPDATGAAFVDGWYRSGDLGYRCGSRWYVSGRCKDLLIVAGHNVFPADVEALVGEHRGFKPGRVAAFAEFDEVIQSERVVVLAEPGPSERPDLLGARQRLTAELGLARVAIHLVPPGWLIKSSSGKMARSACAEKWTADRSGPAAHPPSRPTAGALTS